MDCFAIHLFFFQTAAKRRKGAGNKFPAGVWGLESRARCAGFSVTEIGNRRERLRVREAGASAAGRGQRPHASFPDQSPITHPRWIASQSICSPLSPNRREAEKGCREQVPCWDMGRQPHHSPLNGLHRNPSLSHLLQTAAKRRWESEGQSSLRRGLGRQPHRPPSPSSSRPSPPSLDAYLSPFQHRRTRSARKRIKLPVRHVLDSVVRLHRTRRRRSRRRYAVAMRRRHAPA